MTERDIARFWCKVDRLDPVSCWCWPGPRMPSGYGLFHLAYQQFGAHRIAWFLTNGLIPEGLNICHTCDNPSCCNPTHLFAAPQVANVADMYSKGRAAQGERHPNHRLTAEQVLEIRAQPKNVTGLGHRSTARRLGVGVSTIRHILARETWSWL